MAANNGSPQIERLAKARINFAKLAVKAVMQVAIDLNAKIADRVQNEGKNAEGEDFGTYATMTQEYKKKKGHDLAPFPQVNFTDTGQMFNSIRPEIKKQSNSEIVVEISAHGAFNKFKMDKNADRFGTIIEASPDELKEAFEDVGIAIGREVDRNL